MDAPAIRKNCEGQVNHREPGEFGEGATMATPSTNIESVSDARSKVDAILAAFPPINHGPVDKQAYRMALSGLSAFLHSELLSRRSASNSGGVEVKALEWETVTEQPMFAGDDPKRFWKADDPSGGPLWIRVHTEDFDGECSFGSHKFAAAAEAKREFEAFRAARIMRSLVLSSLAAEAEPVAIHPINDFAIKDAVWLDGLAFVRAGDEASRLRAIAHRIRSAAYTHPSPSVSAEVTVTDEMVERAARAMEPMTFRANDEHMDEWGDLAVEGRAQALGRARAALTAALSSLNGGRDNG